MENKGKVQQKRLRGRNMYDVVNQLVTEYNSSNGWALVRVAPNLLNLEVLLERNAEQGDDAKVTEPEPTVEKAKAATVEDKPVEKKPTTTKKATTSTATKKS